MNSCLFVSYFSQKNGSSQQDILRSFFTVQIRNHKILYKNKTFPYFENLIKAGKIRKNCLNFLKITFKKSHSI